MKTIAFIKSDKENENRRVLLPADIEKIDQPGYLFFENGYGDLLNIADEEFTRKGCHMVSREEALKKDVVVDPKIGDAKCLDSISDGATIFGWIHAERNQALADLLLRKNIRAVAWEYMHYKGEQVFKQNSVFAGMASVYNAYLLYGKLPIETKVAIIGNGNTARGAMHFLKALGADIDVYNRKNVGALNERLPKYDVIVNCVLWDLTREDHLISREDLNSMKKTAMIVDVSCDKNGAIETCIPTTIENPTYYENGILHYAVDHTPSLFHKTFSTYCSSLIQPYINDLIEEKDNPILEEATVIKDGKILKNLFCQ